MNFNNISFREAYNELFKLYEEDAAEETPSQDSQSVKSAITALSKTTTLKDFVTLLDKDNKSKAFKDYLQKYYAENKIPELKQASASIMTFTCDQLLVTQNNISVQKSLEGPLKDISWLEKILTTPERAFADPLIVYDGKYIIDGHHRWSKVYALNGPKARVQAVNFAAVPGVSVKDMLKAVQLTIVTIGLCKNNSLIQPAKGDNMITSTEARLNELIKPFVTDPAVECYKKSPLKLTEANAIVEHIVKNCLSLGSLEKSAASGSPARDYMPQTDTVIGGDTNHGLQNPVVKQFTDVGLIDMT